MEGADKQAKRIGAIEQFFSMDTPYTQRPGHSGYERRGGPTPTQAQARPQRGLPTGAIIAGLVVVAAGGAYLRLLTHNRVSTDNAAVEARVSSLSARVAGAVEAVLVNDNQTVAEGEVLVRLDTRDYSAALEQARAAVAIAQGQYDAAAVGVPMVDHSVRSQVEGVRSALTGAADGELKQARMERQRMERLVQNRIVAQEDFDRADAAFQQAQAKVGGIQASLRQARAAVARWTSDRRR